MQEDGLIDKAAKPPKLKLMPVHTMVLYFGNRKWTGSTDLVDLFENIPETIRPYFNNWKIQVIDVKHLDEQLMKEKDNQDLIIGLRKIYNWDSDPENLQGLTITKNAARIVAAITGDEKIYDIMENEKGDEVLCMTQSDYLKRNQFKKEFKPENKWVSKKEFKSENR